jgi:hypothetical protein
MKPEMQIATTSASLDVYQKIQNPIEAIEKLGEMIAFSGLFGCSKKEQGQVLAMQCLTEGKPPLELAKTYHMIDGKLSMKADAMLAKFQLSGGKVTWKVRTNEKVTAVFEHRNQSVEIQHTLEEHTASGVAVGPNGKLKDNWRKFPRQMLTARCISEGVRLLAPEIVFGVYTPEEQSDFTDPATPVGSAPVPIAVNTEVPVTPKKQEFSIVERLEAALEPHEESVNAYLLEKRAIGEGQTFRDLDAKLANRILGDLDAWLKKVLAPKVEVQP